MPFFNSWLLLSIRGYYEIPMLLVISQLDAQLWFPFQQSYCIFLLLVRLVYVVYRQQSRLLKHWFSQCVFLNPLNIWIPMQVWKNTSDIPMIYLSWLVSLVNLPFPEAATRHLLVNSLAVRPVVSWLCPIKQHEFDISRGSTIAKFVDNSNTYGLLYCLQYLLTIYN